MLLINFPEPSFRIKKEGLRDFIFDNLRKKWLVLTPEEWVRQNFVQYLMQVLHYPSTLIALEKEIWLGELKKRFDILVYDTAHRPWMIVECKSGSVNLNDDTLQQALRYNISVPADFLIITNGNYTFGWEKRDGQLQVLNELPVWHQD
jgi:hypothetical protein